MRPDPHLLTIFIVHNFEYYLRLLTHDMEETMRSIKNSILILLSAAGCLTLSPVGAAEICECGFTIGGDYLYWSPCLSNLHFAAEGQSSFTEESNVSNIVNYHFIDPDWNGGFRLYLGKEDLCGCFDVMATYTNFSSKCFDSIVNKDPLLSLTWPTPLPVEYGRYATTDWKIDFQRAELVVGYSIEFGKGCGLCLKPFAGADYASICQDRIDKMHDVKPIEGDDKNSPVDPSLTNTLTRSLDYKGIGPMVGIGYDFELFEGLSTFGKASLSLLVGKADIEDEQEIFNNGTTTVNVQKYKDKCVCVPGVHLQTGLSLKTLVCNKWLLLRAGYEYLQYIHAPSHLMYNTESPGSFTGLNHNSVTFQGFFGGVAFSF